MLNGNKQDCMKILNIISIIFSGILFEIISRIFTIDNDYHGNPYVKVLTTTIPFLIASILTRFEKMTLSRSLFRSTLLGVTFYVLLVVPLGIIEDWKIISTDFNVEFFFHLSVILPLQIFIGGCIAILILVVMFSFYFLLKFIHKTDKDLG